MFGLNLFNLSLDLADSLISTFLSGPDFPNQWLLINPKRPLTMARVVVSSGINKGNSLPDSQLIVAGNKAHLQELKFETLSSKLNNLVDEKLFKSAQQQLDSHSSIPIYLNLAKFVKIPTEFSRHGAPSNSSFFFKDLKATKVADSVKNLSVVLVTPYEHVLAHVAAISKAFPSYSRKTKKNQLEEILVEVVVTDDKPLTEADLKFLSAMGEQMRICAAQVDAPCNEFNSEVFANEAVRLVDNLGVSITKTVIKGEELKDKGFGGIYHVGKAAAFPPYFVCFSYTPSGASKSVALVGKGINFDTGGMQIKTKTGMPGMKCDMAGAASVLGSFCTLVRGGFKENLHCLLCIAENSVSEFANRPDDIITMLSGKTVEISNTDAEGRLVLGDGVFYAKDTLKAETIIDMATLTGAQAYATGKLHCGVLTNSEEWEVKSVKAGRASGDMVHPFVFAPELHFKDLDSPVADMKNSNLGSMVGPPSAIGGLFIGAQIDFGKDLNWLHFDIASPAMDGERATGFGIPLVCKLLGEHVDAGVAK